MTNLTHLTITEALDALNKKQFSAVEYTKAHIDAAAAAKDLNCYITETPDLALKQAAESDSRRASGKAGLIDGVPVAVKDFFCTKGVRTTCASKILGNFVPEYESTVTANMFAQGAVMLGKTNADTFGMGSTTGSTAFGQTYNPWRKTNDPNTKLVPGGSSGGSSAAVAARIAPGALGTDTGGSIRQPAAMCGIAGIKPTYGRCSRYGIIAYASSLDQAGVFARSVEDCAVLLQSIAGHDPKDSTSADKPVPDFRAGIQGGNLKGLKVGIPREYRVEGMPKEIEDSWNKGAQWMKEQGAEIIDVSLPNVKYALPAYYILAPCEASSNLARYDGVRYGVRVEGKDLKETYELSRAQGFEPEVKRRIMIGTYALSAGYYDAYYVKAQKVRRLIRDDYLKALSTCDVLLTPITPSAAFPVGQNEDDPIKMYLEDIFTISLNLAGLPGMTVPAMLNADGLPLGLQIIGRPWDEQTVFRAARGLEIAADFRALPARVQTKMAA